MFRRVIVCSMTLFLYDHITMSLYICVPILGYKQVLSRKYLDLLTHSLSEAF